MKRVARRIAAVLWWFTALSVVLVALVVGVARVLLPLASDYRREVESWLGAYLQHPVSVERLDLRWVHFGPQLTLNNMRVADPSGETQVFAVDEAYLDTDLWQLLLGGEGVIREVTLAGLALDLDLRVDGSVALQGVELWGPQSGDGDGLPGDALAVFAGARRISLVETEILVRDWRQNADYLLQNVRLRIENEGGRHRVRADLPLPSSLGGRLQAALDFLGDPQQAATWSGTVFVGIEGLRLDPAAPWRLLWQQVPLRPLGGSLDGVAWLDWSGGRLHGLSAQVTARELVLQGGGEAGAAQWRGERVAASATWRRTNDGWDARVEDLRLEADGTVWPATHARLRYVERAGERSVRGDLSYLELREAGRWWRLAAALGLVAGRDSLIAGLAPRGELRDIGFHLPLAASSAETVVSASFRGLTLSPWNGAPGVRDAAGDLLLRGTRGRLHFAGAPLTMEFPGLFRAPLRADQVHGEIGIDLDDGVRAWSPRLQVANRHLETVSRFEVRWTPDAPLLLDLQSDFRNGDGRAVSDYLPVGIMPAEVVAWLDDSVREGRVVSGSAVVYGPAEAFPYRAGDGVFQVDFDVRDVRLRYAPDWPEAQNVTAHVRFAQAGLDVAVRSASILGAPVSAAHARFEDLLDGVLEVTGEVAGTLPQALEFVRESPLNERLGGFFAGVEGSGPTAVGLDLRLPVREVDRIEASGTVGFDDTRLTAPALHLRLEGLRGEVAFDQRGLSADALRGRLNDRPVRIAALPEPGGTRATLRGSFAPGDLLGGRFAAAGRHFEGRAPWRIEVHLPAASRDLGEGLELRATSEGRGTAINLPAPVSKPAAQPLALLFGVRLAAGGEIRVAADFGELLQARLAFADAGGRLRLLRGDVRSGPRAARLPERRTLRVSLDLPVLDLDGWLALSGELGGGGLAGDDWRLLEQFDLRSAQTLYRGRPVGPLGVDLGRGANGWTGRVDNPQLSGRLSWPARVSNQDRVELDLALLDLGLFAEPAEGAAEPGTGPGPEQIPPLQFRVSELRWGEGALHAVHVETVRRERQLVIEQLGFESEHLRMQGQGVWRAGVDGGQDTRVSFRLDSENWGEALAGLGFPETLREGQGQVSGELSWGDAPYRPGFEQMAGQLRVSLRDGNLIGADPGIGRVFGMFSLQALPRRLSLDFKDFFASGFEFDRIKGTVEISDRNAYTRDMSMRGTVGRVDVRGRSNLVERTYQQEVVVTPNLSASIPVLGELAVPGSGLAVLLVGTVLKGLGVDVESIGQLKYTLTGPWEDPVLRRVEREVPVDQRDSSDSR